MAKKVKLTAMIEKDVMNKLKDFIIIKWPREPHGKLSLVVEEAIKEYVKRHSREK